MSDDDAWEASDMIDLGELSLVDLARLDDSVLAHALRRVLADASGPDDPIAAFDSCIGGG